MTNITFQKLCLEWEANYRYNEVFMDFVASLNVKMCSNNMPFPDVAKNIRKEYKKHHPVWFRDFYDADIYIEMMPMNTKTGEPLDKFTKWQKLH